MTKHTTLSAEARGKAGKGAARAVRREGKVPAVIYGDNKEPVLISLTMKDIAKASSTKGFFTSICDIDVAGKKFSVVPRDMQVDPVKDFPVHLDFLRVTDKTIITVAVPVHVFNEKECPALAKGCVVNFVHHELEVDCPAGSIPEEIRVDLTGLVVGDSIHIRDLKLPADVKPIEPAKATVLTIVAPSSVKSDDATAAAAAPAAAAAAAPAAAAAKAPAGKAAPAAAAAKAPAAAPAKKK